MFEVPAHRCLMEACYELHLSNLAQLMAAAPELLAALKESIALNDTLDPRTEAQYKEIIAKAEEKSE